MSNKLLVKNSIFLNLRMVFLMLISLYTSRIILKELGVSDFGIYGIVGGVVGIFASLRSLFSSAIQRFLNVEIGTGDRESVKKVFNLGVELNVAIAVIFAILLEVVGIWFLENKLSIPSDRYAAAVIVFHISVSTAILTIFTNPLNAMIIAKQKMNFYAYSSILDALLKLTILFLIEYFKGDKLIIYAWLMLSATFINFLLCQIYCRIRFVECRYKFYWDKAKIKEMASFSGWNFAGITIFTIVSEGINVCLNLFGGVVLNAARTIAYQVRSAIMQFVTNINTAITPHAIQIYAQGRYDEYFKLMFFSSKTIVFIFISLSMPIYFYIGDILQLWLTDVPDYSIDFVRCILIYLLFRSFHAPLDLLFKSEGRIKEYQLAEMIILSLPLIGTYIGFKCGMEPYFAFILMAIFELINLVIILIIASKVTFLNLIEYMMNVFMPVFKVSFPAIILSVIVSKFDLLPVVNFTIIFILNVALMMLLGFTPAERHNVLKLIKRKQTT